MFFSSTVSDDGIATGDSAGRSVYFSLLEMARIRIGLLVENLT
jgi:hypothetical protein